MGKDEKNPKSTRNESAALQLVEYKTPYKLVTVSVPNARDGELLVRIKAASFCHTDFQVYEGVYQSKCPIIPSHEPKVGQRVGVLNFRHACGECNQCMWHKQAYDGTVDARFCKRRDMAGITAKGGFAEYMVADAMTTVLLPDVLSFEQAAPLMCAGATVWNALDQCSLKAEQSVAIVGIGGLGILAVQFAKARGLRTVAVDKYPDSLELLTDTGPGLEPDLLVGIDDDDALQRINNFTNNIGLKAVIVCNDNVAAAEWSLKLLQPRGICIPLGLPENGYFFNAFDLGFKELVIKGSLCANTQSVETMMKTVVKHNVKSHVTTIPLAEAHSLPTKYIARDFKGRLVVLV
ncbi:alcohol dehydrogenase [Colletotrichum spaethianum]|uniref:Alcohol dehydrogenase n=1 Tax=Colletotrichum spaethianum TaxID=700344 RepID=A0AA37P9I8_9PEZI|nr:alcohol dehydrogenase [Colletotrichum spaethianum]GKT48141.1 alcohol dehydrogenase [Colletotrichum spaethianum]